MKKKLKCKTCGSTTPCIMCHGTKVYPYRVNPPEVKWGPCGACIGGIEHNYNEFIPGYPGHGVPA